MSEGLKRARKPFRARNALTGLGIMAFVGSVYGYSISAVKQDDFSDLPLTGKEGVKSIEEELEEKVGQVKAGAGRGIGAMMGMGSSPQGEGIRESVSNTSRSVASTATGVLQTAADTTERYSPPQPTPLSSPLPPSPSSPSSGNTPAIGNILTGSSVSSASSRPDSRFVVGAPNVDKIGSLWERKDESSISGKRVA